MEFRIFCDNKGCRKEMRPVINKDSMVAFCTECNQPINNISPFMKRQMVSEGQIQKTEKKKLAWAVKCTKCQKEGPPEMTKDEKLVCSFCHEELDLNKPFAQMIRVNLKAQRRAGEE